MDWASNTVASVTGAPVMAFETPMFVDETTLASRIAANATPGTFHSDIRAGNVFSILLSASFQEGSPPLRTFPFDRLHPVAVSAALKAPALQVLRKSRRRISMRCGGDSPCRLRKVHA